MEAKTEKHTWRVALAYDGTDFHGWQIQPGHRTVQGELSAALEGIVGERVLPQGSGRTDAGVHALAQVASFQLSTNIPQGNLFRALNRRLPAAIRVLEARRMPQEFHARHSALGKTYEYRIFRGENCSPWLARYVSAVKHSLDTEAMQKAAQAILGEHDFTSFAAGDPEVERRNSAKISSGAVIATDPDAEQRGNSRSIFASSWLRGKPALPEFAISDLPGDLAGDPEEENLPNDGLLIYRVRGSGFLHHMVRNLVGTFLDVGRGSLAADAIPQILAARSRSKAGPTAPARGLFLTSVDYPPRFHGEGSAFD